MAFPLVPQPKARPQLLEKRKRQAHVDKINRQERAKCHKRSRGQCEVIMTDPDAPLVYAAYRCGRRASENHHLLSGIGVRNRGRSILAQHRLDVCKKCHSEITGKVLVPCVTQAEAEWAQSVRYELVK